MNRNNDYKRIVTRLKPKHGDSRPTKNVDETSSQFYSKGVDTVSRCCYVVPDKKDFTQTVQIERSNRGSREKHNQNDLFHKETYRDTSQLTSPTDITEKNKNYLPETLQQLKELKKIICCEKSRVENSSQYVKIASSDQQSCNYVETDDGAKWQSIEDIGEIDKLIERNSDYSKGIYISDVPRVRVIAEKYSKFRKENVELRKFEEKIVCVEYDVYRNNLSASETSMPSEHLRAFFIVKPSQTLEAPDRKGGKKIKAIPSNVKRKFKVSNTDLKRTDAEEIEIIDGKITENRPYLDNLKSLLKRKRIIHTKRDKNSLDLHVLYEVAKRNKLILQDDFYQENVLTKAEFKEIKDYILNKTNSNISGITRRTINKDQVTNGTPLKISQIIVNELMGGKKK